MNSQLQFLLGQAIQYLESEKYHSAELLLKQALKLSKKNPDILRLLGIIKAKVGNFNEALNLFLLASKEAPYQGVIFSNLGNVYNHLQRYDEAIASYEKAIALSPDYAEAYSNLGNTLFELRRYDEAIASYEKAIALSPDYAEAYSNLGNTLFELRRYDEAIAFYEKSYALNPNQDYLLGNIAHLRMLIANWQQHHEILEFIRGGLLKGEKVIRPFPLLSLIDSPSLQLNAAKIWMLDKCPPRVEPTTPMKYQHSKIRIGYFSADFHNHATSYLMAEFFELHDKEEFEIIAFSFGPKYLDQSRMRLMKSFDQFIDVSLMSDLEIAQLSRNLEIDIAVDLKGYTTNCRTGIFTHHAAPIQINFIGYPGTLGAPYIDYIIADSTLIPESDQTHYTEKIIYLPGSYQVNDSKREISNVAFTKAALGLPQNGIVFCCFNNSYKITPAIFDSWSHILNQVPDSVLWLIEDSKTTKNNLINEMILRDISPDRLIFAPRLDLPDHLARHKLADLFLDTSPCNAHTTASDALWAGLPVLTLMGESFAGRVCASLLNAIKLPELITYSLSEYESLAIKLANDPNTLNSLKRRLDENRLTTPLFNAKVFTLNAEAAFKEVYLRKLRNLPPENISIVN